MDRDDERLGRALAAFGGGGGGVWELVDAALACGVVSTAAAVDDVVAEADGAAGQWRPAGAQRRSPPCGEWSSWSYAARSSPVGASPYPVAAAINESRRKRKESKNQNQQAKRRKLDGILWRTDHLPIPKKGN
uniref:Uncharacterized protein n=1 Tax=Oryza glumipatula TaxID=40148 RepID=A0A0E0BFR5_9ORYZ